jgi:hypothetical protein
LGFSTISCSSSDGEEKGISVASIYGTWYDEDDVVSLLLHFNSDGTGYQKYFESYNHIREDYEFTYTFDGKKLVITGSPYGYIRSLVFYITFSSDGKSMRVYDVESDFSYMMYKQ